jgi:copper chaperone CopZ
MTTTTTLGVTGMTCQHCVKAVTSELSAIDGVTRVDVELQADGVSRVTVASGHALARSDVEAAIEEAGYVLTSWEQAPVAAHPAN